MSFTLPALPLSQRPFPAGTWNLAPILSLFLLLPSSEAWPETKDPEITSVAPNPYLPGRTLFTLHGSGFEPGAQVAIESRAYGPKEVLLGEPCVEVASPGEIRLKLAAPAVLYGLGGGGAKLQVRNPDGKTSKSFDVTARPVTLHVMMQTHLDIGYNGPPSEIAERYKKFYDWVVKMISEDREQDPDGQVRFTVETLWQLEQFVARSTPEEVKRFFDLVRAGRIEVCGGYANPCTSALAAEDLSRLFYPAAELRRKYGIPIETVVFDDQPGYAWGLADVAAASGFRYFACGVNLWKGRSIPGNPFPVPRLPFYWVGRSGARILTWTAIGEQDRGGRPWDAKAYQCSHGGAYGSALGDFNLAIIPSEMVPNARREMWDEEHLEARVLRGLGFFADRDYPHQHLLIMGANGDNNWVLGAANERSFSLFSYMADAARRLNAKDCGIRVRLDTPTGFFKTIEKEAGQTLPELPAPGAKRGGDWPSCWEVADGAAPHAMARMRVVGELAPSVEKVATLNDILGRVDPLPAAELADLWKRLRIWNEHTAPGATINGEHPGELTWTQALQHDREHIEVAKGAYDSACKLAETEMNAFARHLAEPGTHRVVVFNPTGWTRSDVVCMQRPLDGPFELIDVRGGAAVAWQASADGQVLFIAQEVPPNGYRLYAVRPCASPPVFQSALVVDAAGRRIENEFYRVTLDENGHVKEIWDKTLGRAVTDPRAPFRFLCVSGIEERGAIANGFARGSVAHEEAPLGAASVIAGECGATVASLVVSRPGSGQPRTEVRLYAGVRMLEFRVTVDPDALKPIRSRKTIWFMPFPLALQPGKLALRLDSSSGYLDPFTDRIPGTYNDLLYAVHGLWAGDEGMSVEVGLAESFVWDLPTAAGRVGLVAGAADGLERPGVAALLNMLCQTKPPGLVTFKSGPADPGDQDPAAPGYQAYPVLEPGLDGPLTLRYRMRSGRGGAFDIVSTASFLGTINNPLMVAVVPPGEAGKPPLPPLASIIKAAPSTVEVTAFKKAAAGPGFVVRLREISGDAVSVTVSSDLLEIRSAQRLNLVEEPNQDPEKDHVAVQGGVVTLTLRGHETAALLIDGVKLKEPGPDERR